MASTRSGKAREASSSAPTARTRATRRSARANTGTRDVLPAGGPKRRRKRSASQESVDVADLPSSRGRKQKRRKIQASTSSSEVDADSTQDSNDASHNETANAQDEEPELGDEEDEAENADEGESVTPAPKHPSARSQTGTPGDRFQTPPSGGQHATLTGSTLLGSSMSTSGKDKPSSAQQALAEGIDADQMIDHLPDLWNASIKITDLLTPLGVKQEQFKQLRRALRDESSRQRRNLTKYSDEFGRIVKIFSTSKTGHVDPSLTESAMLMNKGIQNVHEAGENLRTLEVFHLANIATLARMLIALLEDDGSTNYINLDFLNREFPLPYLADIGHDVGDSSHRIPTLKAALRLRIAAFKSVLEERGDQDGFVVSDVFEEMFFISRNDVDGEEDSEDVLLHKGWNVPSLASGSLGGEDAEDEVLTEAVAPLDEIIRSGTGQNGQATLFKIMSRIDKLWSTDTIVLTLLKWISLRAEELTIRMQARHPDGIDSLQQALDALSAPKASSPVGLPTGFRFRKADIAQAANEMNQASPQRVGASGTRVVGGRPSVKQTAAAPRTPVTKVKSRTANRKAAQPVASRPAFIDRQENAKQVGLIRDTQQSVDQDAEDQFTPPNGQGDVDEEESEDEFEIDVRSSRKQRPARKVKKLGSTTRAPPTNTQHTSGDQEIEDNQNNASNENNENNDQLADEDQDENDDDQNESGHGEQTPKGVKPIKLTKKHKRTRTRKEAVEEPSEVKPIPRTEKSARPRTFWTLEQDQALMEGLREWNGYYNMFRKVEELYFRDKFDVVRSNVDLKDRARNLKFRILSNGQTLPAELNRVVLKQGDIKKLQARGITIPDDDEPDVEDEAS